MTERFRFDACSVRWLGYRVATDEAILAAARQADAVVMTKDRDFPGLVERYGSSPGVIWNTFNARIKEVLDIVLPDALALLERGRC